MAWRQVQLLTEPSQAPQAQFGRVLAVSGTRAAIHGGRDKGTYCYERIGGTWTRTQVLEACSALVMTGDWLFVSQAFWRPPNVYRDIGRVLVFRWMKGQWTLVQELKPVNYKEDTWPTFGRVLALSGDLLAISEPNVFLKAGKVHVFIRQPADTWIHACTLESPDGVVDSFGQALAISGYTLAIGSYRHEPGSVYTYSLYPAGHTVEAIAFADLRGSAAHFNFGRNLAIGGDCLLVDTSQRAATAPPAYRDGGVLVYAADPDGWALIQTIQHQGSGESLGEPAVSADRFVAGAPHADPVPPASQSPLGSAYVFDWNGSSFIERAALRGNDTKPQDFFGSSVAIDGDTVLVHAPLVKNNQLGDGAVYIFENS